MSDDTAFLTLPLTPEGELGPEFSVVSGVFDKMPEILKETLGIILDAEIEVSPPTKASFSKDDLVAAIDPATVCLVQTSFSKGIEGESLIIAKNDIAKAFVEVILGAPVEGEDEGLSADSMDAFLELVNQISGKVNLSFSEVAGSTVSTGSFSAFDRESQQLSEIIPDGTAFCTELGISVADKLEGAILFLYSATAVEQLAAAGAGSSEPSIDDIIAEAQAEESAPPTPEAAPEPVAVPAGEPQEDERLNVIMDMEIPVRVRFGETQMYIKDLLQLGAGSIIELNKSVDTPVDLVVNEDLVIAKGEVVVVESNFGIRITKIKSKAYRIKGLG